MISADTARALATRAKENLLALEATLTTDEQRAAAALLHRTLRRAELAIAADWSSLFPGDAGTFSTGDKPDDDGDD